MWVHSMWSLVEASLEETTNLAKGLLAGSSTKPVNGGTLIDNWEKYSTPGTDNGPWLTEDSSRKGNRLTALYVLDPVELKLPRDSRALLGIASVSTGLQSSSRESNRRKPPLDPPGARTVESHTDFG